MSDTPTDTPAKWLLAFGDGSYLLEEGTQDLMLKLAASYSKTKGKLECLVPLNLPAYAAKLAIQDFGPVPETSGQDHLWVHGGAGLSFQCPRDAKPLDLFHALFSAGERQAQRRAGQAWTGLMRALGL